MEHVDLNQFDTGGINPLESRMLGVYFDDWMNQHTMVDSGVAPRIRSPLDVISPFSSISRDMFGSTVIPLDNKPSANFSGSFSDTTRSIALTREFCTRFLDLGRQLEFMDNLWERAPGDIQREAVRKWATGSGRIQESSTTNSGSSIDDVKALDTIFDYISATTVPIVAYRVFTSGYDPNWFTDGRYTTSDEHKRFMSVSLSKTGVYGYNGYFMEEVDGIRSYFVKVIIPPGTKVIPILNYCKWSKQTHYKMVATQFEFILPRHSNVYNVPDAVSICTPGTSCPNQMCLSPHFIRNYIFKDTGIHVPGFLASILERTFFSSRYATFKERIPIPLTIERHGYPTLIFELAKTRTGDIPDILMRWRYTTIGNEIIGEYIIEVRDDVIVPDRRDVKGCKLSVPNEDAALPLKVIALSNTLSDSPQSLFTVLPTVNDLFVILPRAGMVPTQTQVLPLLNGWYILYSRGADSKVHVQLYNPRIYNRRHFRYSLPYDNVAFQGGGNNLIHIDDIGFNNDLTLVEKFALIIPIFGMQRKQLDNSNN